MRPYIINFIVINSLHIIFVTFLLHCNNSNILHELQQIGQMVSSLGYMDDANWFSDSKKRTEKILATADEFYKLIKSAINKDKTKILTNKNYKMALR